MRELNPRYTIGTITTKDKDFALQVKVFTNEYKNISHEDIYRRGLKAMMEDEIPKLTQNNRA